MIDLEIEKPISLREATKLRPLQKNGRPPHISALYRWCHGGCRGIVLESIVIGGSRCTSVEAIDRWITLLTAKANHQPVDDQPARTPTRRQRDHDRADASLAGAGW
jgi:hypothetical protein